MLKIIILIFVLFSNFFVGNSVFANPPTTTSCTGTTCITSSTFEINTSDFSVGGTGLKKSGDSKGTINNVLGKLIQNLMIALGVISLLIMTIGAGYMILYHGEDEFLTKGKNIFIAGISSLIVALSSYYMVNLVAYLLYN